MKLNDSASRWSNGWLFLRTQIVNRQGSHQQFGQPMKNLVTLLLACLLTAGLVYFVIERPDIPVVEDGPKPLKTESDFREKIAEIRMNKERLERGIAKLEDQKADNVKFLKEKGIRSVANAEGDPAAEMAIRNLKGWTESIKDLRGQLDIYDSTISRLDGMLTKIQREMISDSVTLTEEQEVEMLAIIKGLNEQLKINEDDPLVDAELDTLLGEELGIE